MWTEVLINYGMQEPVYYGKKPNKRKPKKVKCPCRYAKKHNDRYIRCVIDGSLRRPHKGCSRCPHRDDRSWLQRVIDYFSRK